MAKTGADMFRMGPKIAKGTSAEEIYKNSRSINKKGTILRLSKYLMRYKYLMAAALFLSIAGNVFALIGPKLSGQAIDAITGTGQVDFKKVTHYCILMAIFYIASSVMSYILSVLMIHITQKCVYQMRKDVYDSLMKLPVSYFDKHQTGEILSRISYDIDTVNTSLSTDLVQILTSVITVVGSFFMMLSISPMLILIFVVTIPLSFLITKFITGKTRPLFRERSAALGRLNGFVEEMIGGHKTIKAYHREENTINKFKENNDDAVKCYYEAEYFGSMTGPCVNFVNNLSLACISVFGAVLYIGAKISIGDISSFVLYSRKFSGPINEAANVLNEFQSAIAAAERVFRLIDEPKEPVDKPDAVSLSNVEGKVDFDNVSFGYVRDKIILKDISLSAKPGQVIAIVGETGAGKTTIINLLMRFYDIASGKISIDDKNYRDYKMSDLRKSFAMVLQDTWLFNGTVYENIAYGNENATRQQVIEAAKAAKIHRYIESLPDGYDTVFTENATNISKGQKQLLTIARAMLLDSSMLILDEATSNVDIVTEADISGAMVKLMKNKTCFVIAHRLSTIQNADRILVVKDGNIVEQGTHQELLDKKQFYYSMYNAQFS